MNGNNKKWEAVVECDVRYIKGSCMMGFKEWKVI